MSNISSKVQHLLDDHLATGKYSSRDQVLLTALELLAGKDKVRNRKLAALRQSLEEEFANQVEDLPVIATHLRSEFDLPNQDAHHRDVGVTSIAKQQLADVVAQIKKGNKESEVSWFNDLLIHLQYIANNPDQLAFADEHDELNIRRQCVQIRETLYETGNRIAYRLLVTVNSGRIVLHAVIPATF
ncbi:MAG TPA: hypothetical protein DDW52_00945 [Planctomycetaceae bacterium]|nr:hypothetical protein [Planctomycetaceae bacterium]